VCDDGPWTHLGRAAAATGGGTEDNGPWVEDAGDDGPWTHPGRAAEAGGGGAADDGPWAEDAYDDGPWTDGGPAAAWEAAAPHNADDRYAPPAHGDADDRYAPHAYGDADDRYAHGDADYRYAQPTHCASGPEEDRYAPPAYYHGGAYVDPVPSDAGAGYCYDLTAAAHGHHHDDAGADWSDAAAAHDPYYCHDLTMEGAHNSDIYLPRPDGAGGGPGGVGGVVRGRRDRDGVLGGRRFLFR